MRGDTGQPELRIPFNLQNSSYSCAMNCGPLSDTADSGIPHLTSITLSCSIVDPIEMFSYIKYYLKDHDPILQALDDPVPLLEASFESVTKEKCIGWINYAGYY